MRITKLGNMLAVLAALTAVLLVIPASAESKARIVRLSEVEGTVQFDRGAGDGFEKAFINLPVIEGCRLKTGKDGHAEVEFEDGSALRLASDSEVSFVHLALGDEGQKLTTVQVVSGRVYANLHPKGSEKSAAGDKLLLSFGRESVSATEQAHFRVELDGSSKATVAVFKGKVTAISPSGQTEVAEKHSATVELTGTDSAFMLAKNYEEEDADAWDRRQTEYHDRYATSSGSNIGSPYAYGMSDLNYYGNFMTLPGYGNVWQPFFTGVDWNPFLDGAWAFYPGYGYMWVSGYPWGWMPYGYGNWVFVPGFGWMWQPGYWTAYNTLPRAVNPPARIKVPTAPTSGQHTTMVGRGLAANPVAGLHRITIAPESAGFGVPRGTVRHLDRLSKNVEQTSRPVVVSATPPASSSMPMPTTSGTPTAAPMRSPSPTGIMTPSPARRTAPPPARPH